MKALKIGIASYEEMKARTLAIARGELHPAPDDPKVWFTSLESLGQVLSCGNIELLNVIASRRPNSIQELATMTGREKSNLSRTLKTMEQYGIVRLDKRDGRVIPIVAYTSVKLDLSLTSASGRLERRTRKRAAPPNGGASVKRRSPASAVS